MDSPIPFYRSFKVKEVLKFLIQRDAEDQGQFCGGIELSRFDGTDGIAGNTDHFCQLRLGEPGLRPHVLYSVFQYQFVVHGVTR